MFIKSSKNDKLTERTLIDKPPARKPGILMSSVTCISPVNERNSGPSVCRSCEYVNQCMKEIRTYSPTEGAITNPGNPPYVCFCPEHDCIAVVIGHMYKGIQFPRTAGKHMDVPNIGSGLPKQLYPSVLLVWR